MATGSFYELLPLVRTTLFSPADRSDRVIKALNGAADIVIADLEDGVAAENKFTARANLLTIFEELAPANRGIIVRISPPATKDGQADLTALSDLGPLTSANLAVMVAKAESAEDVRAVSDALGSDVPVIPLIETATGALAAAELARVPGVVRLALGAIDLGVELGCEPDSATAWHVRAQLVLASAAAGIAGPIESPCPEFRDLEAVTSAAQAARTNGLTGILCIHPAQLAPAAAAFAPSSADISWAEKVVDSADGATALDGQMIDRPVILKAKAILAAAQRS